MGHGFYAAKSEELPEGNSPTHAHIVLAMENHHW